MPNGRIGLRYGASDNRGKGCPSPDDRRRASTSPHWGEAKTEPGFFPFGYAQGFGWWKGIISDAL